MERHGDATGERGQRVLVRGCTGREGRRRVPVRHPERRRSPVAQEPVRQPGREFIRQRPDSRSRFRLDGRCLRDAAVERAGHLRNAHRDLLRHRRHRRAGHLRRNHPEVPVPARSGDQRDRDHADRRIRDGFLVGLQPRAAVFRRGGARRPAGALPVREGRARARHRRPDRRGLQPLRPGRPRPVAIRRMDGRRSRRRHLFLRQRAARRRPGAPRVQTTGAPRCASTSGTTRCSG